MLDNERVSWLVDKAACLSPFEPFGVRAGALRAHNDNCNDITFFFPFLLVPTSCSDFC